mmetsp:Transcript_50161/g.160546  ORF Transcript_50161/g.160546 Transcript_50161/m.160546 type:complete len:200 (+) Transcript_50161:947-1546(+)
MGHRNQHLPGGAGADLPRRWRKHTDAEVVQGRDAVHAGGGRHRHGAPRGRFCGKVRRADLGRGGAAAARLPRAASHRWHPGLLRHEGHGLRRANLPHRCHRDGHEEQRLRFPPGFLALWRLQRACAASRERGLDGHRRERVGGVLEGQTHSGGLREPCVHLRGRGATMRMASTHAVGASQLTSGLHLRICLFSHQRLFP